MNYPINTSAQLRGALRQRRGLSQTQVGQMLGVSQKRVARIEAIPERTSFDQIAKLVALLGGRVVIDDGSLDATKGVKPSDSDW